MRLQHLTPEIEDELFVGSQHWIGAAQQFGLVTVYLDGQLGERHTAE
jgi:hypothetical protein